MVSYQAPLSMGFPRQEYWSGLPFPSPGDLPVPGNKPGSPALQTDSLPPEPPGKSPVVVVIIIILFNIHLPAIDRQLHEVERISSVSFSSPQSLHMTGGKGSACNAGDLGLFPGSGRSPGGGNRTHSSILAWRIPWREEPGGLQSIASQRVLHD